MMAQTRLGQAKPSATTGKAPSAPFGLSYIELAAAVISVIVFALVITYYFTTLKPEQVKQDVLKRTLENLKKTESDLQIAIKEHAPVPQDVAKDALVSLEAFKSGHLKNLSQGRISLIESINGLAKKNSVQLVSGIGMNAEKPVQEDDKSSKKRSAESALNVFPHIKIEFTVAGEYGKLRSFINELEANKQFVTIDSVTLSAIKEKEGGRGRKAGNTPSGISLAIGLTAYFQP